MNENMTVSELYDAWQSNIESIKGYNTGKTYKYYFDNYLIKRFGNQTVNSIPAGEYTAFVKSLNNIKGMRGQVISTSTLKQVVRTFHHLFIYGNKEFGLNDPARNAAVTHKDDSGETIFTADEVKKLKATVSQVDLRHQGIMICLYTGITRTEICELKWENVDLDNGIIRVRHPSGTKTKESRKFDRDIPLPEQLSDYLKLLKQLYHDNDYLLTGIQTPMDVSVFRYHYINLLKKAGIEYRKFGTLRNTYAANCVNNGMDILELHELLDNMSLEITAKRFVDPYKIKK